MESRLTLSVKEKEIHGYTMEKLKENMQRMIEDLRQDGHIIDARVIETQMMRRVTSIDRKSGAELVVGLCPIFSPGIW